MNVKNRLSIDGMTQRQTNTVVILVFVVILAFCVMSVVIAWTMTQVPSPATLLQPMAIDSPTPTLTRTLTPATVLEWEGVYIGMPADNVLKIHPKSDLTEDPVQLGQDSEGLVVRWSYPGAYLIISRWERDGVYCYRVREIQLK
jgi:hypothetical protein